MTKIYWYCQICKCEPEAGTIGVNRRDEEYHTVCGTGLQLLGSTITYREKAANFGMYLLRVVGVVAFAVLVLGVFELASGIADDVAKVAGGAR